MVQYALIENLECTKIPRWDQTDLFSCRKYPNRTFKH